MLNTAPGAQNDIPHRTDLHAVRATQNDDVPRLPRNLRGHHFTQS